LLHGIIRQRFSKALSDPSPGVDPVFLFAIQALPGDCPAIARATAICGIMMFSDPELDAAIFDTMENMIVVVDLAGRVVRMNRAAERVTGYPRAEAIGRIFWEIFVAPDEASAAKHRLAQIIAGLWPRTYEREWRARDGSRRQIRWTSTALPDGNGQSRLVIGVGADITDSWRAEGALRDQTRLLRSVLESVGDGVAVVDSTGKFLVFTPEAQRIVGRPAPSLPREQWPEYFGFYLPDGVTQFPAEQLPMARAIAGESSDDVEIMIRHLEWPEPRWCSVNGRPLRDENGRICGGVIASRDITERKRAERELLFRKSLLESQIEASNDGVLVVDNSGKILLYNTFFALMWGIPADVLAIGSDAAAIGAVLDQLHKPEEFVERIAWLYRHPKEQSSDELHLKDGRTYERFSAPIRSPGGGANQAVYFGRVWHFHDITNLKRAEASARAAAESARESAQIARQSEAHYRQAAEHNRRLAREIDHRVGNNLAALLGLVDVTRGRAATVDALADAIQNRLRAMAQVHQLLRDGQWRRVALAELIASAQAAIDQQPQAGTVFYADGPEVWIEPHQVPALTMVLVELLTNSAKHGVHRSGGRLSLTWEIVPPDSTPDARPHLRASWLERGGPPIVDPIVPSLGTELVEGFITRELLGRVVLRYPPAGADHLIEFPLASEHAPLAEPA
jgi:PAS domain S-box-containing protein